MREETSTKIEEIIDLFIEPNEKSPQPKLWNPDTDILNTITRLRQNIFAANIKRLEKFSIKKCEDKNNKGNDLYKLCINDIDITPSKLKKPVALSTTRQYCQFLSSIDYIFFSNNEDIHLIKDEKSFEITHNFNEVLSNEYDFIQTIINTIINSQKKSVEFIKNLGFSLLLYICYKNGYRIPKDKNIQLTKKSGKMGIKYFSSYDEKKLANYILKLGESYKCVEELISKEYLFDDLICSIYNDMFGSQEGFAIRDETYTKLNNYFHQIGVERPKLRTNIIKSRVKDKEKYQDLQPISEKDELNDVSLNLLEAAHIVDVWRIKHEIKKNVADSTKAQKLLELVSNPNNGILISKEYHNTFDRGYWSFNSDGQMIVREEFLQDFDNLKLVKCRIKKEVFNEQMRKFITLRN